jgi:hypothetical protein
MKAQVIIPKGWRRLLNNQKIKCGDKFLCVVGEFEWRLSERIGRTPSGMGLIYIRKTRAE